MSCVAIVYILQTQLYACGLYQSNIWYKNKLYIYDDRQGEVVASLRNAGDKLYFPSFIFLTQRWL